jgi:hypothetical protein
MPRAGTAVNATDTELWALRSDVETLKDQLALARLEIEEVRKWHTALRMRVDRAELADSRVNTYGSVRR